MYKVLCLKCNTSYEDSEPDNYYCSACLNERKAIAAEIDKKMSSRSRVRVKTELELYDSLVRANNGKFPNYKNFLH